jgi:DMSO/TMAO reductase YedYZ molybdopterin-dependent catalytic subunit
MRRGLSGALDAVTLLAAGELAAAALPGSRRGPLAGLVQRTIDTTPGPMIDLGVATLETADKLMLRAAVIAECAALGAVLPTRGPTRRLGWRRPALVATTAAAAFAIDRAKLRRLDAKRTARPTGGAPPSDGNLPVPGLSPLFTPNDSFYVTDVAARPPRVDPNAWRLRVHGMTERPLALSLDDLEALGLEELDATLVCVHNPVGGDRIGTARWVGVPLARLLDEAGVQDDAEQLVARSVDGFTAGVPVERIRSGAPAMLAIGMNGEPLPFEHGFPARLIVPGLWGADANTKWIAELELTTWEAVSDYWDRRGWPRQPSFVQPAARIDAPVNRAVVEPGSNVVAGVAWAPPEGVAGVEVQVDGGEWRAAELGEEVAPTMWRQWQIRWEAPPGEHVLRARAIGRRRRQPEGQEPPYPVGSRGYHEHRVTAAAGSKARVRLGRAFVDDLRGRFVLGARGLKAWHDRGWPPTPQFPAPARHSPAPRIAEPAPSGK